ncbi:MAG: hypothetical protein DRP08_02985 [Candidatus Aenigmatarchaeota archaeon]|nr:MAG: hypothetical protein DRP08_02985 [Candidatus Aenigmarchaeota archaeon]
MSHFSLTVVGYDVDEMLAPYCEHDKSYMTFTDTTDEDTREYIEGTANMLIIDGEQHFPWSKEAKAYSTEYEKEYGRKPKQVEVKFTDIYDTFDNFENNWFCRESITRSGETRYGHYNNPNAKWDWYTIGGRWDGYWLKKDGSMANQTLKAQIDFDKMIEIRRKDAEYRWNYYHKNGKIDDMWIRLDLSEFEKPLDEYVECAETPATFAILWKDKWYERGEMMWFGVSIENEAQWNGIYREIWDSIHEEELITIVDYHI